MDPIVARLLVLFGTMVGALVCWALFARRVLWLPIVIYCFFAVGLLSALVHAGTPVGFMSLLLAFFGVVYVLYIRVVSRRHRNSGTCRPNACVDRASDTGTETEEVGESTRVDSDRAVRP